MSDLPLYLGIAAATLVSEDLTCAGAGVLAAQGAVALGPAVVACFAGIVAGDLLLYAGGRVLGRRLLAWGPLRRRLDPSALERASSWLTRRGVWVVAASRFLPGTRLPTYLAAGALRTPFAPFALWFCLAAAVWTPLLVVGASRAGSGASPWLAVLLGLAPVGLLRLLVRAATWRGRRLLASSWHRLTHWEFWPVWAVYPPVLLGILVLGLRWRRLTLFTACNPAMPASGVVGESKAAILGGLDPGRVAPFAVLSSHEPPEIRWARARAFAEQGGGFPVVVKPDVGERGAGVTIARDLPALGAALAGAGSDVLVQRYVPGHEYGVFYVRRPEEPRGRIFAVTDKRTVEVVGDGRATLERLILTDPRARSMARFHLREQGPRLGWIPAVGERVVLAELGTHCRGALFLDGGALVTPALEDAVERVSRSLPGFHFGRYDVRAPSQEAFQRGEFTVLELNGVTSEATSIYDPRHGLVHGWGVLFRQWRWAFRIGEDCRRLGLARPIGIRRLAGLMLGHLAGPPAPPAKLQVPVETAV